MSTFAQSIRSFRDGNCSRDQLLKAVDRDLEAQAATPHALLSIFDREHATAALPTDLRHAVSDRISAWLHDDTVFRASPAPVAEDGNTVFLNLPGTAELAQERVTAVEVGGTLQGRFKMVERIGEGGMSHVYKAIDLRRVEARSEDPYVAVKVLTVPFGDYFSSLEAMHREAHKLQSLAHPNIVRVMDMDRDGSTVFMTMEFLAGQSLQRRLTDGMPRALAEPTIASIASALDFAHRHHIVHGDLKPGNVIVTDTGDVKVIDFGIARFLPRRNDSHPAVWEALSALTPPYASPEMLEGLEPDPRDDVYGLACIAYELLVGKHPFGRTPAHTARDQGLTVARAGTMSIRQFKAIERALRFERADRTSSVKAFLDEFNGRPARMPTTALSAVALIGVVLLSGLYWMNTRERRLSQTSTPALAIGEAFRDCATCPLMRVIPAGKFQQGSTYEASEQPVHEVALPRNVAFSAHEVTVGEFQEFATETHLQSSACEAYDGEWQTRADVHWNNVEGASTASHPVSCASWDEASAYAAWLSTRTRQHYRLPSASEWEYAASGGADASNRLDAGTGCTVANVADAAAARTYPGWTALDCDDRYAQVAPVGSYKANAFGLTDMLGNVFEWVQDCWNENYSDAPADGSARMSGDCTQREMRGGSWFTSPDFLRASYRNRFEHGYRSTSVGFRVLRDITPSQHE